MKPLFDQLPNFKIQTLLLAGELDRKYREIVQETHRLLPVSRTAVISQAGHNIHLEQPEAFQDELRRFLSTLPS